MSDKASPIGVKSIDHVTLVVADLERSKQFYVDTLGMQLVPRPGFGFDGLWFQAGGTQIHLILEHEGSTPAGSPLPAEKRSSRTHHFAFEVENAHAAANFLTEQDIDLVSSPKQRPDGAVQMFVSDPDGHVVELCSPATG